MANGINALEWYKEKMKSIVMEKGYVQFVSVIITKEEDNIVKKNLEWLFNYYDPSCYDTFCVDDEISFSNDGTSLHSITIWVKERWSVYEG